MISDSMRAIRLGNVFNFKYIIVWLESLTNFRQWDSATGRVNSQVKPFKNRANSVKSSKYKQDNTEVIKLSTRLDTVTHRG